jgi:hypothetical protein
MPPQKRKSDEVEGGNDRSKENTELLSRVRGEVANNLSPRDGTVVSNDVDQNISEIRAILTTNAEIFDRCMGSRKKDSYSEFVRYSFEVVTIKVSLNTIDSKTRCIAYSEPSEKSFDMTPLASLPDGVADIFTLPKKSFGDFIDYEAFFEKSLILHEDVLGTFLEQLKIQLICVQVRLGEIETWLMETASNMNYLESKFGMQIVMPENDVAMECQCPYGTHPDLQACRRCGKYFFKHYGMGCHPTETTFLRGRKFTCNRKPHLLKELTTTLPGKFDLKLNISKENDRKRLEKVLELIEIDI